MLTHSSLFYLSATKEVAADLYADLKSTIYNCIFVQGKLKSITKQDMAISHHSIQQ